MSTRMTQAEFDREQAALLKQVPAEIRPAVAQIAWEMHSYGYEDVLSFTEEVIGFLREPLKRYAQRIENERKV